MALTRAEKTAAKIAAFKYIVNEVLDPDPPGNESLLMEALERIGITNIYELAAISDSDIELLKVDVDGVMTPLVDGAKDLPCIFRHYVRHRNDMNDPINDAWTSITDDDFYAFRISEHFRESLIRDAHYSAPSNRPSQSMTRSSIPRDDEATELRERTEDEAIELRERTERDHHLFQQKKNEKSEQFSEAIKNATFPLELPPPPQNKIVETTIQSLPPSFDPATIDLIVETKIENAPFLDELPPSPHIKV
jgi:hypothetical protein